MAIQVNEPLTLRTDLVTERSMAIPANTSSYRIEVPYLEAEWAVARTLTIEAFDGDGHDLGKSVNTEVYRAKGGAVAPFYLDIVMGLERKDTFPADRRAGRTVTIDGVQFQQVRIASPMTVRITVDAVPVTFGLVVDTSDRAFSLSS